MGRRQPCVQAFSRTVPVWKPGCGRQAWCVSQERRYVGRVRGRGLCSHQDQGGLAGGTVPVSGPPVPPTCSPSSDGGPSLTPPGGRSPEARTGPSCSAGSRDLCGQVGQGPGREAATLWGKGGVSERETPWGNRGPCGSGCLLATQGGEKQGAHPVSSRLEPLLPDPWASCPSPCETFYCLRFYFKTKYGERLCIPPLRIHVPESA